MTKKISTETPSTTTEPVDTNIINPGRRNFLTAGAVGIAAASALPTLGFSAEEEFQAATEDGVKMDPAIGGPFNLSARLHERY